MNQSHWVLVTGGAKRLGREFCLAFARAGWNVVCHFNTSDTDALETQKMVHDLGKTCNVIKQDLSAPDAATHLLDQCALQVGHLPQCIVNNASVSGLVALAGQGAYTATKHGVVGLTKAAAVEAPAVISVPSV
jgi:NAD(P)-dependent dehydrogenase (short-subunit alcohol dehydrogenase family)